MSKQRREKRDNNAINKHIQSSVLRRTEQLVRTVLNGYQGRLNNYLKGRTPEFIDEIGYAAVRLTLTTAWKTPTDQHRGVIEKTRKIKLNEDQQLFFCTITRGHYANGECVFEYAPWANAGFQTKELPTQQDVELMAYESILGYLAEKGIEYMEAERITKIEQESNDIPPNLKQSDSQTREGKSALSPQPEETAN